MHRLPENHPAEMNLKFFCVKEDVVAEFSVVNSLLGGVIIGLAGGLLLLFNGRIAGISGILGGFVLPRTGDWLWRVLFLLGLVIGGLAAGGMNLGVISFDLDRSIPTLIIAGLLVGFGTHMGGGCTSGHGVCGMGRLSIRSIVATATFFLTGIITVYIVNHLLGGSL